MSSLKYKFYSVFLLGVFVISGGACNKAGLPALDSQTLFEKVESVVRQNYLYAPGETGSGFPRFVLGDLYAAAHKALHVSQKFTDKAGFFRAVKKIPGSERRAAIYRSLQAFLAALPAGVSDFSRPEGLVWSRDPERTDGVGLVIHHEGPGKFLILDVMDGSAAHREKIPPGLYLQSIDGVNVADMDLEEIVGRIKGPPDTEVRLDFGEKSYTLIRGKSVFRNILNATWDLPNGEKAEYILLRSSIEGTAGQLRSLVFQLGERKALILDLRKIHTGDYRESFLIANNFVKGRKLGSLVLRDEVPQVYTADEDQIFVGPLYVLVGKSSSPVAHTLAMALSEAPGVVLCGAVSDVNAFLARIFPVVGGLNLRLTVGAILTSDDTPLYNKGLDFDVKVPDVLPPRPPLTEPDPDDPAQVRVKELLFSGG